MLSKLTTLILVKVLVLAFALSLAHGCQPATRPSGRELAPVVTLIPDLATYQESRVIQVNQGNYVKFLEL